MSVKMVRINLEVIMDQKKKTQLFPFEDNQNTFYVEGERLEKIQELWEGDEAAFMNFIVGLLQ